MKKGISLLLLTASLIISSCSKNSTYHTKNQLKLSKRNHYYSTKPFKKVKSNKSIPKKTASTKTNITNLHSATNSSKKCFYMVCSYYGKKFQGKITSNGEVYDMNKFTCANKTLPFGTILKVSDEESGLSVNVRVNDRGPFVDGRDLDLSKSAAEKIGLVKYGVKKLKVEIIAFGD